MSSCHEHQQAAAASSLGLAVRILGLRICPVGAIIVLCMPAAGVGSNQIVAARHVMLSVHLHHLHQREVPGTLESTAVARLFQKMACSTDYSQLLQPHSR